MTVDAPAQFAVDSNVIVFLLSGDQAKAEFSLPQSDASSDSVTRSRYAHG